MTSITPESPQKPCNAGSPSTPADAPPLTHSTSLPTIPTFSPKPLSHTITPSTSMTFSPSPSAGSHGYSTPTGSGSTSKSRSSTDNNYHHPYLIQTTASSLLTRTNSSPSQPVYEGGSRHRVSRSMSALSRPDLLDLSGSEREEGTSMNAGAGAGGSSSSRLEVDVGRGKVPVQPGRGGMTRSGTSPCIPTITTHRRSGSETGKQKEEADLLLNPKTWTPSELAQYLVVHLRTGGPDGHGQILPAPLVEDIKTWVLRHQVSGRAFLKGPDGWASSGKPPPFLPLLASLSRRLRRSSLQGRIPSSFSAPILPPDDSPLGRGSVLMEEDEFPFDSDDQAEAEMTGVKRMAFAYDARSSASEASGDESLHLHHHPAPLKPHNTGESERVAIWKRWEAEQRAQSVAPLKADHTGSSAGGASVSAAGPRKLGGLKKRRESELSAGGLADVEASPKLATSELPHEGDDALEVTEEDRNGTIKASSMPAGLASATSVSSPPPPYTSPDPDTETSPLRLEVQDDRRESLAVTPARQRQGSAHSVTPTPDRPTLSEHEQGGMRGSEARDSSVHSYGDLGLGGARTSHRDPSRRQQSQNEEADDDTEAVGTFVTARRVTIRPAPNRVSGLFEPPTKSRREEEMEKQLKVMMDRIKELEGRLESVETGRQDQHLSGVATESAEQKSSAAGKLVQRPKSPILAMLPEGLIGRMGYRPGDGDDKLPKRVRELPGYLFLVGFGVGAVVMRVLFSRR